MAEGAGRLPSFKEPRDLTQLTSATSSLSLAPSATPATPPSSRPKRIYKPNIPPKRDRSKSKNKDDSTPSSAEKKEPQPPHSSSSSPSRGKDSPGGGRGRGRGRGRNLIQTQSIFQEGVGSDRDSIQSPRASPSGRGRGSSSNSRPSSFSRTSLQSIIQRDQEEKRTFAGSSSRSRSSGFKSEPGVTSSASSLPSSGLDLMEMRRLREEAEERKIEALLGTNPDPENTPVTLPLSLCRKSRKDLKNKNPPSPPSVGVAMMERMKRRELVLLQLPSHLPVRKQQQEDAPPSSSSSSPEEKSNSNKKPSSPPSPPNALASSLLSLPHGRIGKFQFLSDGSCRFLLEGGTEGGRAPSFAVDLGRGAAFRQELGSVDLFRSQLLELGEVSEKFLLLPELHPLIPNTERNFPLK